MGGHLAEDAPLLWTQPFIAINGCRTVILGRPKQLPDPAGLLEGTGAKMRHVKVRTLADVARPELRALVVQGVASLR